MKRDNENNQANLIGDTDCVIFMSLFYVNSIKMKVNPHTQNFHFTLFYFFYKLGSDSENVKIFYLFFLSSRCKNQSCFIIVERRLTFLQLIEIEKIEQLLKLKKELHCMICIMIQHNDTYTEI